MWRYTHGLQSRELFSAHGCWYKAPLADRRGRKNPCANTRRSWCQQGPRKISLGSKPCEERYLTPCLREVVLTITRCEPNLYNAGDLPALKNVPNTPVITNRYLRPRSLLVNFETIVPVEAVRNSVVGSFRRTTGGASRKVWRGQACTGPVAAE